MIRSIFNSNDTTAQKNPYILDSSLADVKKDEGNELYKTRNYSEALSRYSEAISEWRTQCFSSPWSAKIAKDCASMFFPFSSFF